MPIFVGTAGWAIGEAATGGFPADGSSLERYASVFPAVEINSSFHRPHRSSTWQRWREAVPDHFRFSVKVPKTISHEQKLIGCDTSLGLFLDQVQELGDKLAVLLLQLPPKLQFDATIAQAFFATLCSRCPTQVVCEPRHSSWFAQSADALLRANGVARVTADPARHPDASVPGGWRGLSYFRLHGSPECIGRPMLTGLKPMLSSCNERTPTTDQLGASLTTPLHRPQSAMRFCCKPV